MIYRLNCFLVKSSFLLRGYFANDLYFFVSSSTSSYNLSTFIERRNKFSFNKHHNDRQNEGELEREGEKRKSVCNFLEYVRNEAELKWNILINKLNFWTLRKMRRRRSKREREKVRGVGEELLQINILQRYRLCYYLGEKNKIPSREIFFKRTLATAREKMKQL